MQGAVAAGHPLTARAAEEILQDGGSAFDAVLAGLFAACVAEPVLASLGGGGFLLARPADGPPVLYDFFAQTPRRRRSAAEADFFPITADFGTATQDFHIGLGSMAAPGMVPGLFAVHSDLGRLPMARLIAPAMALARQGVVLNRLQAYILDIVKPIYTLDATCRRLYGGAVDAPKPLGEGACIAMPDFAGTLEALAGEGERLFRDGPVAAAIVRDCAERGGHLDRGDLAGYRVERRAPLARRFAGARILTNPPPASGGLLIAFALALLDGGVLGEKWGTPRHLTGLARALAASGRARQEVRLHDEPDATARLLDPALVARYRAEVAGRPAARRGTTHISVVDAQGNAAAATVSNGEGCGYVVPGTGVMMNNMLGEEDINPHGFGAWPEDVRMASMMAPTLVEGAEGAVTALGSGGSNRIRSAILQVLVGHLAFGLDIEAAVAAPRIHIEGDHLSVEPGLPEATTAALLEGWPDHRLWSAPNLFFGGVHAARGGPGGFDGAGDARRGGVLVVCGGP